MERQRSTRSSASSRCPASTSTSTWPRRVRRLRRGGGEQRNSWRSAASLSAIGDDDSVLDDQHDVCGVEEEVGIGGRIAGNGYQVCPLADLDGSDLVRQPEDGGIRRG